MPRVALLDVNVLVALFDPEHVHHELAHDWFADHRDAGWATCPVTQAGLVRVLANPAYRPDPPRPGVVIDLLRRFCASGQHHFWPADVSLLDDAVFDLGAIQGHRQLTDLYLLGLARKMTGALATFDRAITRSAVKGLMADQLLVIAPQPE
jgi:toxin-antitoxin system PIN domain toxin